MVVARVVRMRRRWCRDTSTCVVQLDAMKQMRARRRLLGLIQSVSTDELLLLLAIFWSMPLLILDHFI